MLYLFRRDKRWLGGAFFEVQALPPFRMPSRLAPQTEGVSYLQANGDSLTLPSSSSITNYYIIGHDNKASRCGVVPRTKPSLIATGEERHAESDNKVEEKSQDLIVSAYK